MAEVTYEENITLWEENTDLQTKICIHEDHLNAITTQLHQLQLETAAQAFAMNTQTMGHRGHNNTQSNRQGGHRNDPGCNTTMQAPTLVMQQPIPFLQPPFPLFSHNTGTLQSRTTANIFAICCAIHWQSILSSHAPVSTHMSTNHVEWHAIHAPSNNSTTKKTKTPPKPQLLLYAWLPWGENQHQHDVFQPGTWTWSGQLEPTHVGVPWPALMAST